MALNNANITQLLHEQHPASSVDDVTNPRATSPASDHPPQGQQHPRHFGAALADESPLPLVEHSNPATGSARPAADALFEQSDPATPRTPAPIGPLSPDLRVSDWFAEQLFAEPSASRSQSPTGSDASVRTEPDVNPVAPVSLAALVLSPHNRRVESLEQLRGSGSSSSAGSEASVRTEPNVLLEIGEDRAEPRRIARADLAIDRDAISAEVDATFAPLEAALARVEAAIDASRASRGVGGATRGVAGATRGVAGASRGVVGATRGVAGASRGVVGATRGVAGASRGVVGATRGVAGASRSASRADFNEQLQIAAMTTASVASVVIAVVAVWRSG